MAVSLRDAVGNILALGWKISPEASEFPPACSGQFCRVERPGTLKTARPRLSSQAWN